MWYPPIGFRITVLFYTHSPSNTYAAMRPPPSCFHFSVEYKAGRSLYVTSMIDFQIFDVKSLSLLGFFQPNQSKIHLILWNQKNIQKMKFIWKFLVQFAYNSFKNEFWRPPWKVSPYEVWCNLMEIIHQHRRHSFYIVFTFYMMFFISKSNHSRTIWVGFCSEQNM